MISPPRSGWLWLGFLVLCLTTTPSILHHLLQHWPSQPSLEKPRLDPLQGTSMLRAFPSFPVSSSVSFCLNPNRHLRHLARYLPWFFPEEMTLPPWFDCKTGFWLEPLRHDRSLFPTGRLCAGVSLSKWAVFAQGLTCLVYLSISKSIISRSV